MEEKYSAGMTGVLQDTIIYKDGREVELPPDHNIIVNPCSVLIAALLKDNFKEDYDPEKEATGEETVTTWPTRLGIKYWAIGALSSTVIPLKNQNSTPEAADNRLYNEIYRKEIKPNEIVFLNDDNTVSDTPTNKLRIQVMFDFDEANTTANCEWFEMGLFGGPTTVATGSDFPTTDYDGSERNFTGKNSGYMINHKIHPLIGKTEFMKVRRTLVLTF